MSAAPLPAKIGKYRVVREIGRGATAVVYEAINPFYPEPVAIKLLQFNAAKRDQVASKRRLLKLLKAEQSVASRLDHPNIVRIFESVVEQDQAYLVMEYFPGGSLEPYCSFEHRLPLHRTIGILFKCCMALDYASRQGIVHRDIKPANILIDDKDNVKITDFGLALNLNRQTDADSTFITGVGSPAYMSPEQIKSYPLDQKTDLYSLGVVLFHLLAGRPPFRARNAAQLIYKIVNADPPSIRQLAPDIPEGIEAILRRALEKDLYSRYRNGAEFAKDLSAVRYQIVDDNQAVTDTSRFARLRGLPFFTEFEEVELWELLRISSWRKAPPFTVVVREGEEDQRFGLVVEGEVELSLEASAVISLGPGEVFGESAYLDLIDHRQCYTVTTSCATEYLELVPSSLALASEECRELLNQGLMTSLSRRLARALRAVRRAGVCLGDPAKPKLELLRDEAAGTGSGRSGASSPLLLRPL